MMATSAYNYLAFRDWLTRLVSLVINKGSQIGLSVSRDTTITLTSQPSDTIVLTVVIAG